MKHYKTIQVNGKQVRLHRHMMEEKLGRTLGFNEIVHHINGDKHDNRIENLTVMSRSDHMKEHPEITKRWKEVNTLKIDIVAVEEMYKKMPIRQIAETLGVSAMTIWYRMKHAGIQTNKRGHKFQNSKK